MSDAEGSACGGLFLRSSPGAGGLRRGFFERDLNTSARRLLAHVDRLLESAAEPGWVFLSTIENDAEAGRFPEVLRNFFALEFWSTHARYHVDAMSQTAPPPRSEVGRITFETRPGRLAAVLSYDNGFCWGADLVVGGVQVPEAAVGKPG